MTAAEIVRDAEGMEMRYDEDVAERLRLPPAARDDEVAALVRSVGDRPASYARPA